MRRAPRRMRQEFWRARAFPMISKRYRLVASLPHPRTGGSLPTLRFRFFRKRVRHVPQPADGAPGRPLPKFDLDTKRAFPLTPEDPTSGSVPIWRKHLASCRAAGGPG